MRFGFPLKKASALCLVAGMILSSPSLQAQAPDSVAASLRFGDGLSIVLPAGWKTDSLNTNAASDGRRSAPDDTTNPLSLLLHAVPTEAARRASLTILRDESFVPAGVAEPERSARARLREIAVVEGYRAEKATSQGKPGGANNILLDEVEGISGDGSRRIFSCVSINRMPKPSLRCYWEYDAADVVSRQEFAAWLASTMLDGARVAEVLSGSASMTPGPANPDPATATATATASAPPAGAASPVPAGATAPGANPIFSAAAGELVSKNRTSLVVIQGDKGMGSGFVCLMNGEPWLLTNAHVLSDNPRPKFTPLGGAPVVPGPALLAVDHDICKIKMPAGTAALEMMPDMEATAKIGDPIVVVGNAEGAGVIKPFEGHIVGLGPNLVEVDAPFVPGNSGSPIIHVASGKVIGIATYMITRKVDAKGNGGVQEQVRRFGYRIDNVKKWEPVNWNVFYAQSAQVARIEETGEEFLQLFADSRAKKLFATTYRNPGIQRSLDMFASRVRSPGHISDADLSFARRELLSNLRTAALLDIKAFDTRTAYDYFKRTVAQEAKFRDEIYSGFTLSLSTANP